MRKACRYVRPISSLLAQSFSTKVYAWGSGHSGVLGQGGQIVEDGYEPAPVLQGLPDDVVGLGAGYFHSLAWTSSGDLYTWGRLLESQLGRKADSNEIDFSATPAKALGKTDVGSRIVFATGSGVATFAVTEDGRLFVAGFSKRGQLGLGKGVQSSPNFRQISLPGKLLSVACGWGHAAAVVQLPSGFSQSRVFTWGWPANNRLGYASHELDRSQDEEYISKNCVWLPRPVAHLDDVPITKVYCGMDSTYCLSQDGQLFSFGDNSYSQLGRMTINGRNHQYDNEVASAAWQVSFEHLGDKTRVTDVSAGVYHCMAITNDNSLLTWGWNSSGQLGLGNDSVSESTAPTRISNLTTGANSLLGTGRVHSVLLTASDPSAQTRDTCYAWGGCSHGRLGTSATDDAFQPTRLDCLDGLKLLDLAVGLDHTMVLVEER